MVAIGYVYSLHMHNLWIHNLKFEIMTLNLDELSQIQSLRKSSSGYWPHKFSSQSYIQVMSLNSCVKWTFLSQPFPELNTTKTCIDSFNSKLGWPLLCRFFTFIEIKMNAVFVGLYCQSYAFCLLSIFPHQFVCFLIILNLLILSHFCKYFHSFKLIL